MNGELTTRSLTIPSHVFPGGGNVRVAGTRRAPLWCLADLCALLGIANARDAAARLDDDEKAIINLNTVVLSDGIPPEPGRGNPNATFVTESGLYAMILRSDKQEAKPFRKWVTAEVLPSIREHGCYPPPAKYADPILALIDALKAERERELADGASPANMARRIALIEAQLVGNKQVAGQTVRRERHAAPPGRIPRISITEMRG